MITRILISKQSLSGFRKLALKSYPLEAFQTLWGRVDGSTAVVSSIRDVPHKASVDQIEYTEADAVGPASYTRETYLGSIHSHPDCIDSAPSTVDWRDAFNHGEHIFLVMSIYKKPNSKFATNTSVWEPRPIINIIHPRLRKPKRPTSPTLEEGTLQEEIACGEVPSSLDPS